MTALSNRSLRAMRARWSADLTRLVMAYPVKDWEASSPEIEVVRNLATAVAQIDMLIARKVAA